MKAYKHCNQGFNPLVIGSSVLITMQASDYRRLAFTFQSPSNRVKCSDRKKRGQKAQYGLVSIP